jgi:DNA-binding transcriptional MerR regulator/quercetin dioxygenase-like cupin family protein
MGASDGDGRGRRSATRWGHGTPQAADGNLRIGDAARMLGVSPSVLRLWERQGLIRPARTRAGYRLYSQADLEVLDRIQRMRAVDGVNAPGILRILEGSREPIDEGATTRGERLRRLRHEASLSLRAAGELSGLSAGFISALERGASGASVATLQQLMAAYGATLRELFAELPTGRLVRPAERAVLELAGGSVRMEQLAGADSRLESHLFVLAPGASSQGSYAHAGEELIFVLDGGVTVWLGRDEVYELQAGDALTFSSQLAHSWENRTTTETRLLWINTPPTF